MELPEYLLAHIPIAIDWSLSGVDDSQIANVSAYFYPVGGGVPIVSISSNSVYVLAELPQGTYDVLIFNEMYGNMSGINFYNEMFMSDYFVGAVTISPSIFYDLEGSEYVVDYPDEMASWVSSTSIEVTTETINYTRTSDFAKYILSIKALSSTPEKLYEMLNSTTRASISSSQLAMFDELELIYPLPVTRECTVAVGIENMSNAQRVEAVLKSMSNGVVLESREPLSLAQGDEPIIVFEYTSAEQTYYDDTLTDGEMTHIFETFGRQPLTSGATYELVFTVVLSTGEGMEFVRDVTTKVNEGDGLRIDIDLTDPADWLILPEGRADGFGVDDWGEAEDVEVM